MAGEVIRNAEAGGRASKCWLMTASKPRLAERGTILFDPASFSPAPNRSVVLSVKVTLPPFFHIDSQIPGNEMCNVTQFR